MHSSDSLLQNQTPEKHEITLLLSNPNNPESLRTVMQWAYAELHDIGVRYCRDESAGHTLEPAALVHETFIRLIEGKASFKNRRHFFSSAAQTMRRILIDSARRRNAQKRGGDQIRVDFEEAQRLGFDRPAELLDFNAVLNALQVVDPQLGNIAVLRVFGGWSTTEAATILGIGKSTARRRWASARAWLKKALANGQMTPVAASKPRRAGARVH